jgi:broad specificity phosphatase PhoE
VWQPLRRNPRDENRAGEIFRPARDPRFGTWHNGAVFRSLTFFAAIALVAQASGADPVPRTTVYLVRHAEKASEPRRNPGLTRPGVERAAALAGALAGVELSGIITSQFARTQATAAPVAQARGLEPVVIRYRPGDFEAHGRTVAATIRERFSGGAVLVVGHSDTVPWIILALGGPAMEPLCEATEYASLFELVVEADTPTRMERASYGVPDPPLPQECRLEAAR